MAIQTSWEQLNKQGNSLLSPAYKTNGPIVFTSGQVGADSNGVYPDSVAEQAENAFTNLKTVLEASGSSIDRVLKCLLFVAHATYASEVNKVYAKHFPGQPARSCVVVAFPDPKIKVEIEAIAEADPIPSNL